MASKHPSSKIRYCFSGPNGVVTCHCCDLKPSGVINPAEYKTKNWWIVHKSHHTVLLQGEMRHPESSNHANVKKKKRCMCYSEDLISSSPSLLR